MPTLIVGLASPPPAALRSGPDEGLCINLTDCGRAGRGAVATARSGAGGLGCLSGGEGVLGPGAYSLDAVGST